MLGALCFWSGILVIVALLTYFVLYSGFLLLSYYRWFRLLLGGKWYLTGYVYSYWLRKRPDGSRLVLDSEDYTER